LPITPADSNDAAFQGPSRATKRRRSFRAAAPEDRAIGCAAGAPGVTRKNKPNARTAGLVGTLFLLPPGTAPLSRVSRRRSFVQWPVAVRSRNYPLPAVLAPLATGLRPRFGPWSPFFFAHPGLPPRPRQYSSPIEYFGDAGNRLGAPDRPLVQRPAFWSVVGPPISRWRAKTSATIAGREPSRRIISGNGLGRRAAFDFFLGRPSWPSRRPWRHPSPLRPHGHSAPSPVARFSPGEQHLPAIPHPTVELGPSHVALLCALYRERLRDCTGSKPCEQFPVEEYPAAQSQACIYPAWMTQMWPSLSGRYRGFQ